MEDEDTGIDMDAALGEIADSLGFDDPPTADASAARPADDGLGNGETVNEEVAAPAAGAATPAAPAAPPAPAAADGKPADPAAAADPLATAPRTWRPEAAATWTSLPAEARQEILKREDDMFKGIEQYKGDAQVGRDLRQAIGKYIPLLQQHNINPMEQISGLMDAHYTLAMGSPDQKLALFHRLASDYGVNLSEAAVAVPPYVDPQVKGLQEKVQSLESTLTAQQQRQAAEARQAFEAEVDKFAADPKNIYFNELVNDMAKLLEGRVANTIAEAYDKAMKLNPVVAAKETARAKAEAEKKAAEEEAAKAAAAKAATAANVRSRARAGSAATPVGSIDDTLNATYAAIMARGS